MSDHNTGHEPHGETVTHGAGHEMDVPPTKELFNIVWGLGALTLLSLVTCVQLFNNQQRDIVEERGKESSQVLSQYRQGMDAVAKSSGELSFKDSTGAEVKQRYVPLAVARDLVLSKPERLLAAPAPKGWQHPDDIAAGAAAGAAGTPGAVQPPPGAVPVPTGTAPVEGVPTPDGVVPANPGTLPGPSTPGAPAADPKIDGAAGTGAAGTPTDPKAPPAGVAPATGTGAGNGATDAGKSGQPTPAAPTPAAPTPAPTAPPAPAPAH